MPEFRALRAQADFLTRCTTPDIAEELTLQPIRRYGMDGAILFSDILILPWAMGQSLEFVEGKGPILQPIRSEEDLKRLDPKRIADVTAPIRETLTRLTKSLPEQTTLIGFAGSPFTVACYMVEGSGSRDFAITRKMMMEEPLVFDRLIDLLVNQTAEMLFGQIEAGAQAVMLFDSWAGLLPPSAFRRAVIEPTRKIVSLLNDRYPHIPVVGFPRLAGVMAVEYAVKTGVGTLALDTSADPVQIAALLDQHAPHVTLQGNLDPTILFSGGEALVQEAQAIRDSLRHRPHVFNLGHGVMQHTPPEHVAELVAAVRSL
ncbi:uroporphyrinogen decarboxylase [Neokomagataea thailandica NBRC 106555]|uniref:Uroporphyrinogen decarboxylase n=1 Tax=Neokomagataea thailandica NBRC 106555 TaxID=1223520 RepID=A0ABQ0QR27_9PROT|nr:uroporphyrinogen decarboxylase [Neokomagataea thailandica NBRC 106555]